MPYRRIPRLAAACLVVAGALLLSAAARPAWRPQPAVLTVRVLEEGTGRPLVNADVHDRASGARRLTDARGEARLPLPSTSARLRVRQLGFQPAERVVAIWPETVREPVVITLSRAALRLSATTSEASNACRGTPDSLPNPLSLLALEQLRFGAEQYERFWDAYPFLLGIERRTAFFSRAGVPLTVLVRRDSTDRREWYERYRPGRVLSGRGSAATAVPLSIGTLADPVFWDHHCLVARRVVTVDGRRLLPLEFLPPIADNAPDWQGTAWVDSATSELRRVDFQLIGIPRSADLARVEGYMTFTYPSPYIARPDSIVSLWWVGAPPKEGPWGTPTKVELVRVSRVKYLQDEPPK